MVQISWLWTHDSNYYGLLVRCLLIFALFLCVKEILTMSMGNPKNNFKGSFGGGSCKGFLGFRVLSISNPFKDYALKWI
jgi:hypothetical protein